MAEECQFLGGWFRLIPGCGCQVTKIARTLKANGTAPSTKLDNNGDLLHNTPNIIPLSAPGKESAYDFDRNGGAVGSNRY